MESFLIEIGKKNVSRWVYLVIHHSTLPVVVWFGVNYLPGGNGTFPMFVLSIVASIYTTYIVVVLVFPSWKSKLTWWEAIVNPIQVKRKIIAEKCHFYRLIFQIAQVFIIIAHGIQPLFYNPCNFSLALIYFCLVYAVLLVTLFVGFILTIRRARRMRMKAVTKNMAVQNESLWQRGN